MMVAGWEKMKRMKNDCADVRCRRSDSRAFLVLVLMSCVVTGHAESPYT